MFGELGQNFPVHLDIGLFEIVEQFAVRDSIHSGSGVYFHLPQSSNVSFFLSPVMESVQTGVK